jgi:hypothetical protein
MTVAAAPSLALGGPLVRTLVLDMGWTSGNPGAREAFWVYIEPSQAAPQAPERGPSR